MTALVGIAAGQAPPEQQADNEAAQPAARTSPVCRYIPVPLPITGDVDTRIKQIVDRLLAKTPADGPRPIFVFEFRPPTGQAGEGSQFERSLSLARYLASEPLSRVQTVAYLPSSVRGHAVLPVIACEQLIIAEDAELGAAGADESVRIEPFMLRGYTDIAERRRTIPPPVVLGMLDRSLAVYKVQTLDGARYVLADELEELKQTAAVQSVETIVEAGDFAVLSGRDLRLTYGFASHLAANLGQLAAALELPPGAIQEDPSFGGDWRALRVDVKGPISGKTVNWIERSIRQRIDEGNVNLICLRIDSPGGSAGDSVRLAHFLAGLDSALVRTVAFVPYEARADAALLALACDEIVMSDSAVLGGPGAIELRADERRDLQTTIKALADAKHRNWSLPLAMVDPQLAVYRWVRAGGGAERYLCDEEQQDLPDAADWSRGAQLDLAEGLTGAEAVQIGVAQHTADEFDEFTQLYHIDEQLESIEPNWAHRLIEKLASPQLAGMLLFVALFALMIEFAAPGLSVAGFVSGLCFLLFFWSQYLHGTAGWLEVLLFAGGVTCILLEVFILPGVGVFGFGGAALVVASIVLASQTFVIPRNSYQLEQLPGSLFTVAAAGAGVVVSLFLMRRYLPNSPLMRRLMLRPPEADALHRRELLADYNHLLQKRGVTTTQLTPSGKARFGDDIVNVISDGDVIARGADVYVVEVRGNHVIVAPIEQA